MSESRDIGVGVALIVLREDRVLMAKRKGSHAAGLYSFPGGHLRKYESWEDCADRELREECGAAMIASIYPTRGQDPFLFVHNSILLDDDKHYITLFLSAEWLIGEAKLMEPTKSEAWEWLPIKDVLAMLREPEYRMWIPYAPFVRLVQRLCPAPLRDRQ